MKKSTQLRGVRTFASYIALLLCLVLLFNAVPVVMADSPASEEINILACSDFQPKEGNETGNIYISNILNAMQKDGITSADGFFCCGDYDYDYSDTAGGIAKVKETLKDFVSTNMVFVQGNHDSAVGTNGLSYSGNNDPVHGKYGVFVINEDDYMWYNENEETVKRTAQNLIDYLNEKLAEGYDKPIFVLSHLALNYSMRTYYDGDCRYAYYLFNALNEAGEKGLNIVYMYGHNHSNGWDDYLGGSSVYLAKGDSILIGQGPKDSFKSETLAFTYLNPGYTGYYSNVNGQDDALTMTYITIKDNEVTFARYDQNGLHNLKSSGVTNSYKNETAYAPDLTVYQSPQTVALTKVTDTSAIDNLLSIDVNLPIWKKVTNTDGLKDGGRYILVADKDSDYVVIPKSVTKANSSGSTRTGFDTEQTTLFSESQVYFDGTDKTWVLTQTNDGWLIGNGTQYANYRKASSSVDAILSDTGCVLTIREDSDRFSFATSDGSNEYYFNYNSRGVVNFHAESNNFFVYEYVGYTVNVKGGNAIVDGSNVTYAKDGATVTLKSLPAPSGYEFDSWTVTKGDLTLADPTNANATFTMPSSFVSIKATYKEIDTSKPVWKRILSENELNSGSQYVIVAKDSADYFLLPKSVSKANSSGSIRIGFDLEETVIFNDDLVYAAIASDKLWTMTASGDTWLVGNGTQYIDFETTSDNGIKAYLTDTGSAVTLDCESGVFNFSVYDSSRDSTYYLNYNSRGVVNFFKELPVSCYIYEYVGHTVEVTGGTADVDYAKAGESVTLIAGNAPEGYAFDKWVVTAGAVILDTPTAETLTFTMPDSSVEVEATYQEITYLSTTTVEGYFQTKETVKNDTTYNAVRILFVIDRDYLMTKNDLTITATFTTDSGNVTYTSSLSDKTQEFTFFEKVSAMGQPYCAEDGCLIFGVAIVDIPKDLVQSVTVTLTDGTSAVLTQGSLDFSK